MDSLAHSNKALAEAFEHLAFSQKAKSRLKNSLDMTKVISGQSVTFELDPSFDATSSAELALDIDESDDEEFFNNLDDPSTPSMPPSTTTTTSTFLSKKTQLLASTSSTFSALANTDELISSSFSSISSTMTPIYRDSLVKKLLIRPGSSSTPISPSSKVIAHYVAICEGADEPHDSTLLRRCPQIFDLRLGDMLPGLFIALQSMTPGEVSKFLVSSSLAFGPHGCYPRVPPSADILFIIEVLQVITEEQLTDPHYLTAEERAKLPFTQILSCASNLHKNGNGDYQNGSYHSAIKKYRKGAAMLEDYPLAGQSEEEQRGELLHTLYCNLAQCYLKLKRWPQACTVCKLGLRSSGGKGAVQNVKLLYRFALAKFNLKDYEGSLKLCDDALKLSPKNPELSKLHQQSTMELAKQTTKSDQMFKGIFK